MSGFFNDLGDLLDPLDVFDFDGDGEHDIVETMITADCLFGEDGLFSDESHDDYNDPDYLDDYDDSYDEDEQIDDDYYGDNY